MNSINVTYKKNMESLNTFLMMYTTGDFTVVPQVSPWFEFFADGSDSELVALRDTDTYKGDWIGLKTLDEESKLLTHVCNCSHQDYPRPDCKYVYDEYTRPLLNNTLL